MKFETTIRNRPRTLLMITEKDARQILRCKVCCLGFVGTNSMVKARKHMRVHSCSLRAKVRLSDHETRQMAVAEGVMRKNRKVLKELAK